MQFSSCLLVNFMKLVTKIRIKEQNQQIKRLYEMALNLGFVYFLCI